MEKIIIKKQHENNYILISARLKTSIYNKLEELASKTNRSRNQIINILLENAIENAEIK